MPASHAEGHEREETKRRSDAQLQAEDFQESTKVGVCSKWDLPESGIVGKYGSRTIYPYTIWRSLGVQSHLILLDATRKCHLPNSSPNSLHCRHTHQCEMLLSRSWLCCSMHTTYVCVLSFCWNGLPEYFPS